MDFTLVYRNIPVKYAVCTDVRTFAMKQVSWKCLLARTKL